MTTETTCPPLLRFGEDGFIEAYGAAWGFGDRLVSFFADGGTYTDKASQVTVVAPDQLHRFMKVYLRFSPRCTVTFTTVKAYDGGFTAEWVWEGTSDGPLVLHGQHSPQDGTPFRIDGVSVCTVDDGGRIQSHVDYWDAEAMLSTWRRAEV